MQTPAKVPAPHRILSARVFIATVLAIPLAWSALRWTATAQAPAAAAPAAPVRYRHKQVAMPLQPEMGKLARPFVPDYEEEFNGWEVVTCIDLPYAPWPLDVKVPADRRYRPIPNQKITWVLYTLRQPM